MTAVCPVCCRGFIAGANGSLQKHCSAYCAMWWTRFDQRARTAIALWRKRCEVCTAPIFNPGKWPGKYAGGYGEKRFCSNPCKEYALGNQRTAADRCDLKWMTCSRCGCWSSSRPHQTPAPFLCRPCSASGERENRRRKNRKRHLAIQGTGGPVGMYTLAEVAQRDGGICHLCRRRVDLSLSGRHPAGPTIDHLVPVSAGGTDDPKNVALAHRSCNVRRGARGQVQLRLIA